jgi:hypothetical protein
MEKIIKTLLFTFIITTTVNAQSLFSIRLEGNIDKLTQYNEEYLEDNQTFTSTGGLKFGIEKIVFGRIGVGIMYQMWTSNLNDKGYINNMFDVQDNMNLPQDHYITSGRYGEKARAFTYHSRYYFSDFTQKNSFFLSVQLSMGTLLQQYSEMRVADKSYSVPTYTIPDENIETNFSRFGIRVGRAWGNEKSSSELFVGVIKNIVGNQSSVPTFQGSVITPFTIEAGISFSLGLFKN